MKLREHIEYLEPLRIEGEPAGDEPLSIVLLSRDLARLPQWLATHAKRKISHIVIADAQGELQIECRLPKSLGQPVFLAGMEHLASLAGSPVFLFMGEWPIRIASMGVPGLASRKIYFQESGDAALARRKPLADYLEKNAAKLEAVYGALAGASDRDVFARRVKSLVSGDPGYLPIAPFLEYEHPATLPGPGDIVLDGGLSDMVGSQKSIAEKIGRGGSAHGFEPIPWMAEKAAQELAPYPQYQVHALGLADKKGPAWFASLRDSSHLADRSSPDTVECRLTTIDDFCAEASLSRVDVIKLDVEGAELAALAGGEKIIGASRPRLLVCLYHKPRDLWEIPLWLLERLPGYEMRIAHSSCGFTDTILYARPDAGEVCDNSS